MQSVLDPPVPVSATSVGFNDVDVVFDRAVLLTGTGGTPPWSLNTGAVAVAAQVGPATVRLSHFAFGPTSVSYAGIPQTVVGDPDGVPVAAFSGLPIA